MVKESRKKASKRLLREAAKYYGSSGAFNACHVHASSTDRPRCQTKQEACRDRKYNGITVISDSSTNGSMPDAGGIRTYTTLFNRHYEVKDVVDS